MMQMLFHIKLTQSCAQTVHHFPEISFVIFTA